MKKGFLAVISSGSRVFLRLVFPARKPADRVTFWGMEILPADRVFFGAWKYQL